MSLRYVRLALIVLVVGLIILSAMSPAQAFPGYTYYPPVLMYHHIQSDPKSRYFIDPALFETQMAYLAKNGYHTITMTQYADALRNGTSLAPKSIVLTFDDGYRNAYTGAFPILKKYGFTGTFYVITNVVGAPAYLTWDQIQEMHDAGMEIGAHTESHAFLTRLSPWRAFMEIWGSKLVLTEHLHVPITSFAYPYNDHDQRTVELAHLAGFNNAVIVDYHQSDLPIDAYTIPRITVVNREGMEAFTQVVSRGYPVRISFDQVKKR